MTCFEAALIAKLSAALMFAPCATAGAPEPNGKPACYPIFNWTIGYHKNDQGTWDRNWWVRDNQQALLRASKTNFLCEMVSKPEAKTLIEHASDLGMIDDPKYEVVIYQSVRLQNEVDTLRAILERVSFERAPE